MSKNETKKQHYVPRFYLNKFSSDNSSNSNKNKILVYDKTMKKSYLSNVYDIACENRFYDLENEEIDNKQVFEDAFSKLELDFSKQINKLLYLCENNKNNPNALIIRGNERYAMSYQMAMQLIRTKKYRNILNGLHTDITAKCIEFIKRVKGINEDISFTINEKSLHLEALLDENLVYALTNFLYDSYWILTYNNTKIPFITSDNPICRIPRISSSDYCEGTTSFFSLDLEINFPITPQICIRILGEENPHLIKLKKYKNKLMVISNEEVINQINIFQYIMSNERIFLMNNSTGEELIEKLSKININKFGTKIF